MASVSAVLQPALSGFVAVETGVRRVCVCRHCGCSLDITHERRRRIPCHACSRSVDLAPPADPGQRPGQMIEHFQLLELLGVGSFGSVWKARDNKLGRLVAIKIPHADKVKNAAAAQNFLREARAIAQVSHPGIVAVHDVRQNGDVVHIVSEYIDGTPLRRWAEKNQPNHRESAALVAKVADALHHAHLAGVVHRDIKPTNILIDSAGQPKLLDFGLAKTRDAGEEGKRFMGTPNYMSPEQAQARQDLVDRRTDIYSLGVILYELLTGERPFRGNNVRALIAQIVREEPPPPRRYDPRIPRDLETITLKCLEKSRRRRYQTADELAQDLRRQLENKPISARPVSRREFATRWVQRNPLPAALGAGVVAMTLLAIFGIGWQWRAALAAADRADALRLDAERSRAAAEEALAKAERQSRELERQLYLNRIGLARRELAGAFPERALTSLDRCLPELRGWEWRYLHGQCRQETALLAEHQAPVTAVAVAPSGKFLVTGDQAGVILFRDRVSLKPIRRLGEFSEPVGALVFGPNDETLACGVGRVVTVWDPIKAKSLLTDEGHKAPVRCVAVDPAAGRVASGDEAASLRIISMKDGKELASARSLPGPLTAMSWVGGEDRLLLARGDGSIRIVGADGKETGSWSAGPGEVRDLALSPSGALVAAVGSEGWTRIFETDTRRQTEDFPKARGPVNAVRWMDANRLVTAGADRTVRILEPGRPTRTLLGAGGEILSLAVAPGGDLAVVGSADRAVRLFDLAAALAPNQLGRHQGVVAGLGFGSEAGTVVSAGADNLLLVHDVTRPQPRAKLFAGGDQIEAFAFEPGADCIAIGSGNGTVELHEPLAGRKRASFPVAGRPIRGLAIAPGEKFVAALDAGGKLRVMNGAGTEERHASELGVDGAAVAVSSEGLTLAVAGGDGKVRLFETAGFTVKDEFTVNARPIRAMVFDSAGRLFIAADGTIHLHGGAAGSITQLDGHRQPIRALYLMPGGTRLVSGGADGVIKIWDLGTLEELLSLEAIPIGCSAISSTADGRRLILGGADGSVTVLDAPPVGR